MKKLLVITLSLAMVLCLFGCGQEERETTNDVQTYKAIPMGEGT